MTRRWVVVLLAVSSGFLGCEEEVVTASNAGAPGATASPAPIDRKALLSKDSATAPVASAMPRIDSKDFEFGESERSRDPFRSYAEAFVAESRSSAKSQRQVILEDFSLDELKLVGIVTGVTDARAMLVDPQGRGYVVRRGQFVGRAEIVHGDGKGSQTFEVNWRIDRIRDGDIVLVREDPKNPEVPSATRVIALRPDAEVKVETLKFN